MECKALKLPVLWIGVGDSLFFSSLWFSHLFSMCFFLFVLLFLSFPIFVVPFILFLPLWLHDRDHHHRPHHEQQSCARCSLAVSLHQKTNKIFDFDWLWLTFLIFWLIVQWFVTLTLNRKDERCHRDGTEMVSVRRTRWFQPWRRQRGCHVAEVHRHRLDQSCGWTRLRGQTPTPCNSNDRCCGVWRWSLSKLCGQVCVPWTPAQLMGFLSFIRICLCCLQMLAVSVLSCLRFCICKVKKGQTSSLVDVVDLVDWSQG